jgi:hypothetical protein
MRREPLDAAAPSGAIPSCGGPRSCGERKKWFELRLTFDSSWTDWYIHDFPWGGWLLLGSFRSNGQGTDSP